MIKRLLSILLLLSSISCFSQNNDTKAKNSRVARFFYGGYGDTTVSFLWGEVFLNTVKARMHDTVVTYSNVDISYRGIEKHDSGIWHTDDISRFNIPFKTGHYNITISKKGYQTLVLKNYFADEDQVSYLEAVLETGTDEAVYSILRNGQIVEEPKVAFVK